MRRRDSREHGVQVRGALVDRVLQQNEGAPISHKQCSPKSVAIPGVGTRNVMQNVAKPPLLLLVRIHHANVDGGLQHLDHWTGCRQGHEDHPQGLFALLACCFTLTHLASCLSPGLEH